MLVNMPNMDSLAPDQPDLIDILKAEGVVLRSDYLDVQADLELHRLHMAFEKFYLWQIVKTAKK